MSVRVISKWSLNLDRFAKRFSLLYHTLAPPFNLVPCICAMSKTQLNSGRPPPPRRTSHTKIMRRSLDEELRLLLAILGSCCKPHKGRQPLTDCNCQATTPQLLRHCTQDWFDSLMSLFPFYQCRKCFFKIFNFDPDCRGIHIWLSDDRFVTHYILTGRTPWQRSGVLTRGVAKL